MPFVVVKPNPIHRIGRTKETISVEPSQNEQAFGFHNEGVKLPVVIRGRAAEIESTQDGFDRIQDSRRTSYKAVNKENSLQCSIGRIIAVVARTEAAAMEEIE
jgi:hypothetical protein